MTASGRNACTGPAACAGPGRYDYLITMKLLTAHKILIASAAVFFVYFALWEARNYAASGEGWAAFRSVFYLLIALGFGVYFKNLKRLYKLK
jgi:hypothetical protein